MIGITVEIAEDGRIALQRFEDSPVGYYELNIYGYTDA